MPNKCVSVHRSHSLRRSFAGADVKRTCKDAIVKETLGHVLAAWTPIAAQILLVRLHDELVSHTGWDRVGTT